MAQRLFMGDRQVWLKHYGARKRSVTLDLLDRLARWLSIEALRPPSHHCGEEALRTEVRRIGELKSADINVPDVVGQDRATLILADIGASLSRCLKKAAGDPAERNRLVSLAVDAISDVHAKGLYLGNPVPRNMTFDNECIGFLDFEEDPGEIMTRDVAQARDWLLFVYGVAGYFPAQHVQLARLIEPGLRLASGDVRSRVLDAGSKVSKVADMFWPFKGGQGKIQSTLRTLRYIAETALLLVTGLMMLQGLSLIVDRWN